MGGGLRHLAYSDNVVGQPIPLSVAATYRLGTEQLTYTWDLADGPVGAPWPVFGLGNGTGVAHQTTVILPTAGDWRLRYLVSDEQARAAVSEVVLNVPAP